MTAPPALAIQILGGIRVLVGCRPVPDAVWRQTRAATVVKLFALEPAHRLHREQLTDTLWPELEPAAAANNLRVALYRVREVLRPAGAPSSVFLNRDGDVIALGPAESIKVDVDAFATAIKVAWRSPDPAVTQQGSTATAETFFPRTCMRIGHSGTLLTAFLMGHRRRADALVCASPAALVPVGTVPREPGTTPWRPPMAPGACPPS